jgi:hypothetical protein
MNTTLRKKRQLDEKKRNTPTCPRGNPRDGTRVMGTCMELGEAAGCEAAGFINSQPP